MAQPPKSAAPQQAKPATAAKAKPAVAKRSARKKAAVPDPHKPVTAAERGLLDAVKGDGVFVALSLPSAARVVRSAFLRALLLGRVDGADVPETGLRTLGLVFEETLNLDYAAREGAPLPPLWLRNAHFLGGARFNDSCLSRLDLEGSRADAEINLDRAHILGNVWLNRLELTGGLSMLGAGLDGELSLRGAKLIGSLDGQGRVAGYALSADRAVIKGGVFCHPIDDQRFEAEGMVRLLGVEIGGVLSLKTARLKGAVDKNGQVSGDVLNAERARIVNTTFLDEGFAATGSVNLLGTTLGDLILQGKISAHDAETVSLELRDSRLRRLHLRSREETPSPGLTGLGKVNLEGATADTFDGFFPERWGDAPTATTGLELDLDGFTYRRAEFSREMPKRHRTWARFAPWDTHAIAENVLELLDREFRDTSPGRVHYMPQPFEAAAKALREAGYDREANAVAVAKREFKRRCRADGKLTAGISSLSCLFFRHGYGPVRATLWMIIFVALGGWAVSVGQAHQLLTTVPAAADAAATACAEYPLAYALDAFLPLVDLGVDKACAVNTARPWGWEAEALRVAYAILGWLFVPMVALTYAGVLRKD